MAKHFLFVVILTVIASLLLRVILANVPVTATWLGNIQVYKQ
jgi:hypothetical protein